MATSRAILLSILLLVVAACAGPPATIVGVDGVATRAADVPGASTVELYVATTRTSDEDPRILFSGTRADDLSFFRVTVSIPPDRRVGEINRPQTLPPDPRRHFVVLDPTAFADGPAFVRELDGAVRSRAAGSRSVLLFVHGFNTDLPSAILLTAQFIHDSGFRGVPVLFSWASRGRVFDYVYDVNSALHARDGLVETARLLGRTRGESFDVLAHSMGNLLVVEAMRQMAITGEFAGLRRMGSVMLASPDIDLDLFREQIGPIPLERTRVYVMVSERDRALGLSRRIAGGVPRVGNADPEALAALGITVVDVSAVREADSARHNQFANVPAVVGLIGTQIRRDGEIGGEGPGENIRNALVEATLLPARIVGGGRVLVVAE